MLCVLYYQVPETHGESLCQNKIVSLPQFFQKGIHDLYDHRPGSVCALIFENCNATHEEATLSWWSDVCKLIVRTHARTHADHRNNVIKTMRLRFIGK